jgi:hypothetical protein
MLRGAVSSSALDALDFRRMRAREAWRGVRNLGDTQNGVVCLQGPPADAENGKPAVVVQDTRSYEQLLDALDRAEATAGIRRGLESMERGQGEPAKLVFDRLRRKYKLPRRA